MIVICQPSVVATAQHTIIPTCRRTLVVNEMIRLKGIKFTKVVKRSPRLGDSEFFFDEDSHSLLEGLVREVSKQKVRAHRTPLLDLYALSSECCLIHDSCIRVVLV